MSNTNRKFIPWDMSGVKTYDRVLTAEEIKRLWQGLPLDEREKQAKQ